MDSEWRCVEDSVPFSKFLDAVAGLMFPVWPLRVQGQLVHRIEVVSAEI